MKKIVYICLFGIISFMFLPVYSVGSPSDTLKVQSSLLPTKNIKIYDAVYIGIMWENYAISGYSTDKPFSLRNDIFLNLSIMSSKTYCGIYYGLAGNELRLSAGVNLKNDWSIYHVLSFIPNSKDKYAAIGFSKTLAEIKNGNFCCFTEYGTNFYGIQSISIGLQICFQSKIYKK